MIATRPELRAWLHSLPAYANQTFGRPTCQTQCAGCAKLAIPGLTTWVIGTDGLCPRCRTIRTANRENVVLFTPVRREGSSC